jgi:hypothetical protein
MDGEGISPCLDERAEIFLWIFDHQMSVEREPRDFPNGLHHRHTDGKIGHEMPVHHVEMDRVGSRRLNLTDLIPETAKVSRKDGRSDFQSETHGTQERLVG